MSTVQPRTRNSLDETLIAVDALETNFGDLAKWFEAFEKTKACDTIGFSVAMELCGCYDLIIRRLGKSLRDTFRETRFIQTAEHVKQADQALKYIASIVKGDHEHQLLTFVQDLLESLEEEDVICHTFYNLQTLVGTLASNRASPLSPGHIIESLKIHWDTVLDIGCDLSSTLKQRSDKLVLLRNEYVKQQNELTSARKEIDRLQADFADVSSCLYRTQATMHQKEELSKICDVEHHTQSIERDTRYSELQDRLNKYRELYDDLTRDMSRITNAHTAERKRWRVQCDKLTTQLAKKNSTSEETHKRHLETKAEFIAQIESLTRSRDTLLQTISSLKTTIEVLRSDQVKIVDDFKLERRSMDNMSSKQIEELSRSIAFHEDNNIKLKLTVRTLSEKVDMLTTVDEDLKLANIKLATMQQCFGFDILECNVTSVLDEIKLLKDASLERLSTFIQGRCLKVVKTDSDDDMEQAMCVSYTPGNFFHDYENQIRDIILTLQQQQHVPMEVEVQSSTQRVIKTPLKRKLTTLQYSEDTKMEQPFKKQECDSDMKRDSEVETTTARVLKLEDVQYETQHQFLSHPETVISSVEQDGSGHRKVFKFTGDGSEDTTLRLPIPLNVVMHLKGEGDIKLVHLGHDKPVHTLLSVLQAREEDFKVISEIKPNMCHCSEMERLSDRLKCCILICWSPEGAHELHGKNHTRCRYAIMVHRDQNLRFYYLISVKINGSYIYNLAKLTVNQIDHLSNPVFIHKSDGKCEGPSFSQPIHCEDDKNTCMVDVIGTDHIVLQGDVE